jgi:putative heme transporter
MRSSSPVGRRRGRTLLRNALSLALVGAIFWLAIPHFASYHSVWASIQAMTAGQLALVAGTAVVSMVSSWIMICAVLPTIGLRQAAVVNLGSNAVANALPAGGALGMGVSWAMLSGWGVSTAEYVLYTLVSGVWNVLTRLGLPVLALVLLATTARPGAGLIFTAATGLAVLIAMAVALRLFLRRESFARAAGRLLQRPAALGCRLARRKPPGDLCAAMSGFRDRAAGLLATRGWRISLTTVASQLTLWLVLLACLRGLGLSQAQVSWQSSLAAYAFIRLLTALPITPGGAGITELGLVGILAAGASHQVTAQVTAAVLLYRAVTYLPPIPLGAVACLVWRHAPGLLGQPAKADFPVRSLPSPEETPVPGGEDDTSRNATAA